MREPWPTITVLPLDAAKQQLDAAIRLLFEDEDPLVIHTLGYAAYGLLKNESKMRGSGAVLASLDLDSGVFQKGEFWRRFSDLANALKHPDREAVDIPEEFNEVLLLICCMLLREVEPLSSAETVALWLWFHAMFFINIQGAPNEYWDWVETNMEKLHATTRHEKLEIGAILFGCLRDGEYQQFPLEPDQTLLPWRIVFQPRS